MAEQWNPITLDEREVREDIPNWFPGRYTAPNQLKLFVRWVCRLHHRCQEIQLARFLGFTESPFKVSAGGGTLERACFELAVLLGRSLAIPDMDLRALTDKLKRLADLPADTDEYGEWHALATNLQDLWKRSKKKEE